MSVVDSVPILSEVVAEDQVLDLVEYLTRSIPEAEQPAFTQRFEESLKSDEGRTPFSKDNERRKAVVSDVIHAINGLGDGSDAEAEGFFNLAFYQLQSAFEPNSSSLQDLTEHIVNVVVKDSSKDQARLLKYRILANLYNSAPRNSPLRFTIFNSLLGIAEAHDDVDALHLQLTDVERWLQEWDVTSEKKSVFLKTISEKLSVSKPEASYEYRIAYVRSLPSTSEAAKPAALDLLATALRSPSVFDFEPLQKLENVKALGSGGLFRLLQIFANEGLSEYQEWVTKNEPLLEQHHLEKEHLLWKMRLLIFSSLGFNKIGQNLTYTEIASALQIDNSEVEKWTVNVIRAGLLSGKLSQASQTLHVVRAAPRGFGSEQWSVLQQRLLEWKAGLSGVQAVLRSTLQSVGSSFGSVQKQLA